MIANNVRILILSMLKDEVKVASWGITNINIKGNKVSFLVYGFIYQGKVTIIAKDETTYEVYFGKKKIGSFNYDQVVNAIDERVEKSNSHYKKFFKKLIS